MSTPTVHSFVWRFGGPLAGLPADLAWTLLGVVTLAGLLWIVIAYRRTLVALPRGRRLTLTGLRLLVWTTLMLALAGPTLVERTFASRQTRPLALLVDRSDSMTSPDNRGQRRLDDALRRWRQVAPTAAETFGQPRIFAFADGLAETDDAERSPGLATGSTRLYRSIHDVLAAAPPGGWGGVVMLTDGLDTAADTPKDALASTVGAAISAGVPLFPLSGRNRYAGGDFIGLRDLQVPARVPPRSHFSLEVTLDTYQPAAREVPVRLRVGDAWRPAEMIALGQGRRALSWSGEIPAQNEGVLPIELQVGDGERRVTARAEVLVAKPDTTRILYYQGALDWGYRFLANILRRDPAFQLTPIFHLSPIGSGTPPQVPGSLPDLPDTQAGLDDYDVVVLSNAAAEQLSPERQKTLSEWVKSGGVLLFLAPDDASTQGYAGTELEQMLPVVFGQPAGPAPANVVQNRFRERMRQLGGANGREEQTFAKHASAQTVLPELTAFAWEPAAGAIFEGRGEQSSPLFADYAGVRRAKPGATVLARHPTAPGPDGVDRAILLAIQRYGSGQSAAFTSDALWRWKLRQPSDARVVEKFWQDLFAWLGRERPRGPAFDHAPLTARVGEEIELRLRGGGASAPNIAVESTAAGGSSALLGASGDEAGTRLYRWTPPSAGEWKLTAADERGRQVRHYLQVSDPRGASENSGQPPDDGLLRALAQRTGGLLLGDAVPLAWNHDGRPAELLSERRTPLWHQAALLAALLLVYCCELLLRRRWQLL